MSVGLFMGIRQSYTEEARDSAEDYLATINVALAARGLPPYVEPASAPDVYSDTERFLFGRSAVDADSGRCISEVAKIGVKQSGAKHLALLNYNPYRVAFVPIDFPEPLATRYTECIAGQNIGIWVGSAPALFRELLNVATKLKVPVDGTLSDTVAEKIREYQPLFEGDVVIPDSDLRSTWLLLHEGARLALEHQVALSFAG